MLTQRIAVFGGAHLDRRGRFSGTTVPGASNPGSWFEEAGGGGFNAARNLARLGFEVRMIAPRGGDAAGEKVAAAALAAGVIDCPFTFLDRATPSYTAILEADGNLVIALADMDLYRLFTPRRLRQRAMRDILAASDLVLMDANLPEETIAALCAAVRPDILTAAIAVSPAKVVRLRRQLARLSFLFMNVAEACALTGTSVEAIEDWPLSLRALGLHGGVVTDGARAAIAFDGDTVVRVLPQSLDTLGDVTGAGDALAAGFLSGRLAGLDLSTCLRRGVAAAALTVASPLAVSEAMTPDRIEQALALVPAAEILS